MQLQMNSGASQDQDHEGIDTIADAANPEKLLEKMLVGSDGPATPFGMGRVERRAAKSATLKLEHGLASRLRERASALGISVESLAYLAWSLVLARLCGQNGATFGAALSPSKRIVPLRIDAATRTAEAAARETDALLAQMRASLPVWGRILPQDPGAAYSLAALFGYGLREAQVWVEKSSSGSWALAVIATEQEETLAISGLGSKSGRPSGGLRLYADRVGTHRREPWKRRRARWRPPST